MKLMVGYNRRQKPLELVCPGGRIKITREPHGTMLVEVLADAGEVVVDTEALRDYAGRVRLTHERKAEP